MKESIDICFLHANSFLEEYAFETMYEKTKCNINVYSQVYEDSYAETMNKLIALGESEYVVIFQSNMLVDDNWCEELLHYSKHIVDAGCVGLMSASDESNLYKPMLTIKDDLKNLWVSKNNAIEGVFMVKRSLITEDIGWFDKLFDNTGYEQAEFSLKLAFAGKNNFYVRKHRCIEMETPTRNAKFSKKTELGTKLINEFVKSNINFKD